MYVALYFIGWRLTSRKRMPNLRGGRGGLSFIPDRPRPQEAHAELEAALDRAREQVEREERDRDRAAEREPAVELDEGRVEGEGGFV